MGNVKFIGWVIFGVGIAYIFLTILMPMFISVAEDAATEIQTSPNASSYALSIAGTQYFPLFIYFVPAVIGIAAVIFKLKFSRSE